MESVIDKCTIISTVPFEIDEFKPGLYPGRFTIPPADNGGIQLLCIGTSKYDISMPDGRPAIEVKEPSWEVARAIVDDYVDSQVGIDHSSDTKPGIAFVQGELNVSQVVAKHSDLIKLLKERTRRWLLELIKMGDNDWARYQSHRVISDSQRKACTILGLEKEWNMEPKAVEQRKCPGCGVTSSSDVVLCPSCKYIFDEKKYAQMKFA